MTFTSAKVGFEVEPMCEPEDAALRESMREARMLPPFINVTFQAVEADRAMKEYADFIDVMITEALARLGLPKSALGDLHEFGPGPLPTVVMQWCKACPTAFATTTGELWCKPCAEKRAAVEAGPGIAKK